MSEDIRRTDEVKPLNLFDNGHEEVYVTLGQIVDHNRSLRDIDVLPYSGPVVLQLYVWLCVWPHERLLLDGNQPEGTRYATAALNVEGKKALKDGCSIVMLVGSHWPQSVEKIRDENLPGRVAELLRMCCTSCIDGKPVIPAHAFKLSKMRIVSTAMECRETSFSDSIQSVLNNAQVFEEDYAVSLVEESVLGIFNKMMQSNFLATNSKATCAC